VLVPRPDTEILVVVAEKQIKNTIKNRKAVDEYRILDLCTGSGVVGISLAYTCVGLAEKSPNTKWTIVLSDISTRALAVSAVNAGLHNVAVNLSQGDLFERLALDFDLIVCNPPYIETNQIGVADKYVLNEPKIALDGGADGLSFYRRILAEAQAHLRPDGVLALEIGATQGVAVPEIARANGFSSIEIKKDLAGRDRVVLCK
jgi:release factor glutamine methyltransferase